MVAVEHRKDDTFLVGVRAHMEIAIVKHHKMDSHRLSLVVLAATMLYGDEYAQVAEAMQMRDAVAVDITAVYRMRPVVHNCHLLAGKQPWTLLLLVVLEN